jgi:hypothetical protein
MTVCMCVLELLSVDKSSKANYLYLERRPGETLESLHLCTTPILCLILETLGFLAQDFFLHRVKCALISCYRINYCLILEAINLAFRDLSVLFPDRRTARCSRRLSQ